MLALPPPPWEAQSPSSSPHYSPTHPMQVTQVVITTHTHQPLGYNPQGGSPHAFNNNPQGGSPYAINNNNNNMFGMLPPPMTGGHMQPLGHHNPAAMYGGYGGQPQPPQQYFGEQQMYGGYGGQPQPPQEHLVEQQMYGMSLQDNGANNANPYQVSSHSSGFNYEQPMMKPVNRKPEDKLFGDLVELSKSKKPTERAGSM